MYLVVGLGNPGEEYEHTRHNAGFDTVDCLADSAGARYWKTECGALTAKGSLAGEDVLFAKPQSYMNTSGGPVKQLCAAHSVKPDHVIVIHDDFFIDILNELRMVFISVFSYRAISGYAYRSVVPFGTFSFQT